MLRVLPECLERVHGWSLGAARVTLAGPQSQERPLISAAFDLARLPAGKLELARADDEHFHALEVALAETRDDLETRIAAAKLTKAEPGQAALERDAEVHRLGARLRTLRRFGLDLCLGNFVVDGTTSYVGRQGVKTLDGEQLLIDWRSPAAAPFFAATHTEPMGVSSRRRYRWSGGRIWDFWDEVFEFSGEPDDGVALDAQSAFLADLAAARTDTMRDVVATIQSDQDAIIRAPSQQTLVVDGGPGTGKTVVALHRAAYLLYADPLLRGNGLLFIGPHRSYVSYVSDVLPSLGEEGVQIRTVADLAPEGEHVAVEENPVAAHVKGSLEIFEAVQRAVAFYEEPPNTRLLLTDDDYSDTLIAPEDWVKAFARREADTTHNDAREQIWESLLDVIIDKHKASASAMPRIALAGDVELRTVFNNAWPLMSASDLVADLFGVPAFLRHCTPGLSAEERAALIRAEPTAWTVADLPILDAARQLLGDPDEVRARHRRAALRRRERLRHGEFLESFVNNAEEYGDDILAQSVQKLLNDEESDLDQEHWLEAHEPAESFAHLIVDEAQELSDAEWRMLLERCPSRSMTVVGDRAQARGGFAETWEERLARIGSSRVSHQELSLNYRTPSEVMAVAAPVIRAVLPDANVPRSVRSSGIAVRRLEGVDPVALARDWLAVNEGIACVITSTRARGGPRLSVLSPAGAKGLEFDLVVVVEPPRADGSDRPGSDGSDRPGSAAESYAASVDRYVAYTRTTRELVIVTRGPAPE